MAINFDYAYDLRGGNQVPIVKDFPIADSQTLEAGDLVVISSGKLAKAGNGTGRVFGVMAEAVTTGASAGGPLAKVQVSQPGQVWRAVASADATSHVLAARTYDVNSSQAVNVADTTGGCIEIVALGATTNDVYVIFTAHELA